MKKSVEDHKRCAILDIHSPLYLRTESGKFCGGDIGDLYELIDKAAEAGFRYIQMNPIQDTSKNPSPYMGISIFSFNPIDLSIERLPVDVDLAQIDKNIYEKATSNKLDHISYRNLYQLKVQVLRQLFDKNYRVQPLDVKKYSRQVLSYATFKALKHRYKTHWYNWPRQYRSGDIERIISEHPSLHREIQFYLFVQETLKKQWFDVRNYAEKQGVSFILDKPIYPVHDSAEVWANQNLFYLKDNGSLRYGSGCDNPRDPFGPQYWGHAVYKFKESPKQVIDYFIESVRFISQLSDTIRLDHSLALIWKYYIANPKTKKKGKHYAALKHKLCNRLLAALPHVKFIAEDLGYVSNRNVDIPLSRHGIPGMRCLQWFKVPKYSKVAAYPENCMAFTSNHDMDSLPAWWRHLRANRRMIYLKQLPDISMHTFEAEAWQLVELVFGSKAQFASITLRDLSFDLRRYNKPGSKYGNWTLRERMVLNKINFSVISEIIDRSGRKCQIHGQK